MRLLIVVVLLPAFRVAAQQAERLAIAYRHVYERSLRPQPSSYELTVRDSLLGGKCLVRLCAFDSQGGAASDVFFAVRKPDDRQVILSTDDNGRTDLVCAPGDCRVAQDMDSYTPIAPVSLVTEPDKAYTLTLQLGHSNALRIMHILSKRPLSDEEIETIVDAYSKHGEIPELVRNSTCMITWQI